MRDVRLSGDTPIGTSRRRCHRSVALPYGTREGHAPAHCVLLANQPAKKKVSRERARRAEHTWDPEINVKQLAHVPDVFFDLGCAVKIVPHAALIQGHDEIEHLTRQTSSDQLTLVCEERGRTGGNALCGGAGTTPTPRMAGSEPSQKARWEIFTPSSSLSISHLPWLNGLSSSSPLTARGGMRRGNGMIGRKEGRRSAHFLGISR